MDETSDDGCVFIVRPQVLPASHMDTHGTGVLAHTGQPEKGPSVVCMALRECVQMYVCVCACYMAKPSSSAVCVSDSSVWEKATVGLECR